MGIADRSGSDPYGDAELMSRIDYTLSLVRAEMVKSMTKHAPMHSPHEGHSVIREEFEELWAHVMGDTGRTTAARKEAIQVAAMGARYVCDLCQDVEKYDAQAAAEQKRKMAELQKSFDDAFSHLDPECIPGN